MTRDMWLNVQFYCLSFSKLHLPDKTEYDFQSFLIFMQFHKGKGCTNIPLLPEWP